MPERLLGRMYAFVFLSDAVMQQAGLDYRSTSTKDHETAFGGNGMMKAHVTHRLP